MKSQVKIISLASGLATLVFVAINCWAGSCTFTDYPVIEDILIDPANTQVIYARANGPELFKSSDRGKTWTNIAPALSTSTFISALAINPNNSNLLYLGSSSWVDDYSRTNARFYKSADGGLTWKRSDNGLLVKSPSSDLVVPPVINIAIDPVYTNVVYASIRKLTEESKGFIFKSIDGGINWKQIYSGPHTITSLAINRMNTEAIFAGSESGILRSTNGGRKWDSIGRGFDGPHGLPRIGRVQISKSHPALLIAHDGYNGLPYISTNAGRDWKRIGGACYDVGAADVNLNMMYTSCFESGQQILKRSVDAGNNWVEVAKGLAPPFIHSFKVDPIDSNVLYGIVLCGDGEGAVASTDGGKTWSQINRDISTTR